MDTSFIIVSLILVGSVFIPFFLFNTAGLSERKIIEEKIKQVIAKKNLNIAKSENWGDTYIGLDTIQKKIIFLKIGISDCLEQLLEVDTFKGCQILEKRKAIKRNEKKEMLLEKLDLEILLKNGDNIFLNFYNSNEDRKEDFELKRIETWKAILLEQIATISLLKKVA